MPLRTLVMPGSVRQHTEIRRRPFGGAGYAHYLPVERMMRDAKVTQVCEGTTRFSGSSWC